MKGRKQLIKTHFIVLICMTIFLWLAIEKPSRITFNYGLVVTWTFFFFLERERERERERESFNLWHPLLMIAFYYQTKTPISFWCRQKLNSKSLIQLSLGLEWKLYFNFWYTYVSFVIYIYIVHVGIVVTKGVVLEVAKMVWQRKYWWWWQQW